MERDKDGDRKHRQKSPMGSFATPHRFSRRTLSHSSRNISYELASMESIPPQTTPPQATTYQSETPQSESSQSEWYSADSRSAIDLSESLQSDIQQAELLRTPEQSAPSQITQWRSAPPQIIQWRPAQQQTLPWQSAPPQPRLHYIAPLQYIQVQQPYHSYSTWHHAQVQPEQIEWQPELSQTGTYQPITLVQASPQPYALPQVELSQTGTYQPIRPVQASPQPYALPQVELSQTGTYQPIRPAQAQPQPYALPQVELSQTGTYQPIRPAQAQPQPYALPQVELSQTGTYQPIRPAQAQPQPYALPQVELPQPSPSKPESLQSSSYQHALPQVELPQPSPSKPESLQSSSYQHAPSQFELSQPGPSLSRLQQPEQAELVQQSQSFKSRAEGIMDPSEEVDVNAEPKEIQKGDIICKEIKLQTNYFKVISPPNWTLHQYNIIFPRNLSIQDRKLAVHFIKKRLGIYSFNGHVLYIHHRAFEDNEEIESQISDGELITLKIKYKGIVNINDRNHMQFFNVIIKSCLEKIELFLMRRNYYDLRNNVRLDNYNLEVWPGFFTSIRRHQRNILMCVDIIHKIRPLDTLLDIWERCKSSENVNPQILFYEKVKESVIITNHNNIMYRIKDVNFLLTPKDTFTNLKSKKVETYQDYYKDRYKISLRDSEQPMLLATGIQKTRNLPNQMKNLVYLIPELCCPTNLTDDMRKQFPLMAAIASRTRVFPNQRITRLLEFNRNICSNPNNMNSLHEWDLTLDNKLVEIEGHILPQEKIFFNNDSVYAGEQANWTSSMNNKVLILAKRLQYWAIICVKESRQIWERFQQILIFEANKIGFRISYPSIRYFVDKNDRVLFNKMMEDIASKEPLQLVVCVDSRIHFKRYCALKTKFCVDRPIPSQMIVLNGKKENLLTSLAKKLAIQINCKLGGVPWYVDIPIEGLMVIGFDVCHDRRKVECDFGATVGSLDNKLTKYISAVSKHNKGEELSNDIANHICKFISRYRDNNDNKYPDYIIIYRDGVGEGQIESVYNHEVKKIKKKLDEMYKDVEIKMAFIIVNKRVNTRIFYNQRNPPCGTVVDSVITSPTANDFFIVSQHVLQGTVTPTSYTVIYNSLELHESMIQQITYKLTHMYYNWSGTIRIPAPCQYAHKLAHLVGVYIGEEPHNDIEDLLYYL